VLSAPEGSFLVTCREGEVVAQDEDGRERVAVPGQVVEKTDKEFRSITVPVAQLDTFAGDWLDDREQIFKSGAEVFISSYVKQFLMHYSDYSAAYQRLVEKYSIFQVWQSRKERGETANLGTLLMERREVSPAVIAMRSKFIFFQQIFYRLRDLGRYHKQGYGVSMIDSTLSSTDFFKAFDGWQRNIQGQFAVIRHYFKLFAENSGFDDSSIMDDMFSDDPLGGSGPPKPTNVDGF
jgi:hypothetical protein